MGSEEYRAHAARLQSQATAAHIDWVKGLSPKQRKHLEDMGILQPAEDRHEIGGHSPWQERDIADSHLASVTTDVTDLDSPAERLAEEFDLPLDKARAIIAWHLRVTEQAIYQREGDLLAIVVGGLIAAKNPKFSAVGLAFATELAATNGLGTQADYARTMGVSRQAISKTTKAWQRSLGLRPSVHQKSTEACATYSANGHANHWRKRKADASSVLAAFRKTAPLN